jgi:hypothetical protein
MAAARQPFKVMIRKTEEVDLEFENPEQEIHFDKLKEMKVIALGVQKGFAIQQQQLRGGACLTRLGNRSARACAMHMA